MTTIDAPPTSPSTTGTTPVATAPTATVLDLDPTTEHPADAA